MEKLNLDFSIKKVIETFNSKYIKKNTNKTFVPLEDEGLDSGRKTSVIILGAGEKLTGISELSSKEILILSGEFSGNEGTFGAGTYFRIPKGRSLTLVSKQDSQLFIKENAGVLDSEEVFIKPFSNEWHPGHGNLKVMALHSLPHDVAALVFWPAGERFAPHKHWGGEEIFVISGEFIDEHGRYPAGTWLRSPHLSSHFPFVEKDTLIMVKTGHLFDRA